MNKLLLISGLLFSVGGYADYLSNQQQQQNINNQYQQGQNWQQQPG